MFLRNRVLIGIGVTMAAGSAAAQNSWTTFPTPNPCSSNNQIYGIAGTSPNDVWAVGTLGDAANGFQSLALHWDGAQWTQAPTPSPSADGRITAIATIAHDDVWAIGGNGVPTLFHFDGLAWSTSHLPNPGSFGVEVSDLVARAPDDIWAVGWYDESGAGSLRTAVWHWNGAMWKIAPSPNVLNLTAAGGIYPSVLLSICTAGPNALFAVGEWCGGGRTYFPLAMRFDGTSWQIQSTPNSPAGDGRLRAVSASSASNVWAVGTSNDLWTVPGGGYGESFAMHYDGSNWSVESTPQPSPYAASPLRSVIVHNGRVVAVGCWMRGGIGMDSMILQLDESAGTGFAIVASTNIPGDGTGWNQLHDVALIGNRLWTAGLGSPAFPGFSPYSTLVECANAAGSPSAYCTAKINSLGCTPAIGFDGTPSASEHAGFTVTAVNVRNHKSGLLFYGISGPSTLPFQGGTLCVKSPLRRTGAVSSGGNLPPANDCRGLYMLDMNAFAHGTGSPAPLPALTVPGMKIDCQWWGRDPGFAAPNNVTLSDGLEYIVGL